MSVLLALLTELAHDILQVGPAYYVLGQNYTSNRQLNNLSTLRRYGLQAAAFEGLAAHSDAQNCSTHVVHCWPSLCAYRRSSHMGQ